MAPLLLTFKRLWPSQTRTFWEVRMRVSMCLILVLSVARHMQEIQFKKLLSQLSIPLRMRTLSRWWPMRWQNLHLLPRQVWRHLTQISRIRITGLQFHTSVDWSIVTFSLFAMVMASGVGRYLPIWRINCHFSWRLNSNTCFKNMKRPWLKIRNYRN